MLVVIDAKILHHIFISTIYENFESFFFFTYVGQTKTWKLACQFDLRNSKVKSTFEVLSLGNILIK